ncbi:hypothetical protein LAZ67_11002287 [Cordylochernes scorpioides]|uniref:Uncharacterized protein n=1 Tax=Cordylochernes scorpioides TaxID=51811 RepID=A0ABY6KZ61_9ARAC|nr:hypothetical protein LAZ67_11002287 [Cordylochernes scorpioides]
MDVVPGGHLPPARQDLLIPLIGRRPDGGGGVGGWGGLLILLIGRWELGLSNGRRPDGGADLSLSPRAAFSRARDAERRRPGFRRLSGKGLTNRGSEFMLTISISEVQIPNMLKILIGPWTTLEQDLTDWNKTLKFPRHLHLGDLPDLDALLAGDSGGKDQAESPLISSSQEEAKRYRLNFMQDGGFVLAMPYSLGHNGATLGNRSDTVVFDAFSVAGARVFQTGGPHLKRQGWGEKTYHKDGLLLKAKEESGRVVYIPMNGFHRRAKAKTSLEDDDVPIDDTTTKPLFTPQENGRKEWTFAL